MTRIFTTGGEEKDPTAVWDYIYTAHTYSAAVPVQTFSILNGQTFAPRSGQGMFLLKGTSILRKDFGASTAYTELFFGFAVRFPDLNQGTFFQMSTDDASIYGNYGGLRVETTGALSAMRTTTQIAVSSAGVVTAGTWHYIEVWYKPLDSNGRFVVYVDGISVIDFTGDTTGEEQFINAFHFAGNENSGAYPPTAFDDIVVNTSAGSNNNTYPGQVRLMPIRAISDGTHSDLTRAGVDLGSDLAQVRSGGHEFTMLQTSTADHKQTFHMEVPDLPVGATIKNIIGTTRARVQTGAGVIAPMIIPSGASADISADQTLLSSWRYHQYAWPLNPADSAAWEEADLTDLEMGIST